MTKHTDIIDLQTDDALACIDEVKAYCAEAGISASTLTVRALNDSRWVDRRLGAREKEAVQIAKIRRYMATNPPTKRAAR